MLFGFIILKIFLCANFIPKNKITTSDTNMICDYKRKSINKKELVENSNIENETIANDTLRICDFENSKSQDKESSKNSYLEDEISTSDTDEKYNFEMGKSKEIKLLKSLQLEDTQILNIPNIRDEPTNFDSYKNQTISDQLKTIENKLGEFSLDINESIKFIKMLLI
ncbi:hypothetical protein NAPIS_ORF02436 [Vairimorpha apis BRL 01]|uniref:Uncharacterized protein n=1 Tax=Vairimorpha apis BRL 01 TaxID=1037528 RepID=T0L5Q0_9MICR|nr:hypothetical protein NAPIS_ORF02436 [Vairimorpha apis BRL 01]